jgi:hypothetical protein
MMNAPIHGEISDPVEPGRPVPGTLSSAALAATMKAAMIPKTVLNPAQNLFQLNEFTARSLRVESARGRGNIADSVNTLRYRVSRHISWKSDGRRGPVGHGVIGKGHAR